MKSREKYDTHRSKQRAASGDKQDIVASMRSGKDLRSDEGSDDTDESSPECSNSSGGSPDAALEDLGRPSIEDGIEDSLTKVLDTVEDQVPCGCRHRGEEEQ